MKKVKWIGEERSIPGYGVAKTGEYIYLPEEKIESFIKQGLVRGKTRSTSNHKAEENT